MYFPFYTQNLNMKNILKNINPGIVKKITKETILRRGKNKFFFIFSVQEFKIKQKY